MIFFYGFIKIRSIIYTKALIQSVLSQLPKKTHLVSNQYTKLDIITALQM